MTCQSEVTRVLWLVETSNIIPSPFTHVEVVLNLMGLFVLCPSNCRPLQHLTRLLCDSDAEKSNHSCVPDAVSTVNYTDTKGVEQSVPVIESCTCRNLDSGLSDFIHLWDSGRCCPWTFPSNFLYFPSFVLSSSSKIAVEAVSIQYSSSNSELEVQLGQYQYISTSSADKHKSSTQMPHSSEHFPVYLITIPTYLATYLSKPFPSSCVKPQGLPFVRLSSFFLSSCLSIVPLPNPLLIAQECLYLGALYISYTESIFYYLYLCEREWFEVRFLFSFCLSSTWCADVHFCCSQSNPMHSQPWGWFLDNDFFSVCLRKQSVFYSIIMRGWLRSGGWLRIRCWLQVSTSKCFWSPGKITTWWTQRAVMSNVHCVAGVTEG